MRTFSPLVAAAMAWCLAKSPPASAQLTRGPYVGFGLGASMLYEGNAPVAPMPNSGLATPSDHFRMSWDPGFIGAISAGWGFRYGLRVELEGVFRRSEADAGNGLAFSRRAGGGTFDSQAVMANLLWDINLSTIGIPHRYVLPYVGGGAGYGWSQWSNVGGSVSGSGLNLSDHGEGMVYQGIVGLSFPLDWAGVPGLYAAVEYRYIAQESPILNARVTGPGGTSRTAPVDAASHNNNILFALRYNFGRSDAIVPAAAAVAPVPARSFLVFFDWNRAELTDRARQIIAEAARARTSQAVTRIEVNGYTDTSGSAQYNQALSVRRANAVAAELVRIGVPHNEIVARGFGETNLLVATPDNTREPQNRRVEIILR
ncbi:OmpA family protein [Roseomonas sp. CAU 1739]|uniref:OmpA family protein n=1 Tax=Roseomonas sp. CAU 1739 TaxID=3140364 RepID=UPI00325B4E86